MPKRLILGRSPIEGRDTVPKQNLL